MLPVSWVFFFLSCFLFLMEHILLGFTIKGFREVFVFRA